MNKKSLFPLTTKCEGLNHLTDVERLRLHDPVTCLECEWVARLSRCLNERDAKHAELTEAVELAHEDRDQARAERVETAKLNTNLCDALEHLKNAARAVIAHWEQGHLANAVNDLRQVVEGL